ncbi:hypothetical protein ACA910_015009 [Epithemia clementina (nom. ined.)]
MASATSASNYFFSSPPLTERLNERKDSTASSVSNKSIENPLLGRDPPTLQVAHKDSTTTTTATATATTAGSDGNLRHRRRPTTGGVKFRDDKENFQRLAGGSLENGLCKPRSNNALMPPPPRASTSLGTANEGLPSFSSSLSSSSSSFGYHHQRPSSQGVTNSSATTPLPMLLANHPHHPAPSPIASGYSRHTNNNCWILVFGYATSEQYQELLDLFSRFGHVLDHCGYCQPGRSNWIAIQYANELEAKKALCHSTTVKLNSNIFCGVQPLDDDDEILLHRKHSFNQSLFEPQPQQQQQFGGGGGVDFWSPAGAESGFFNTTKTTTPTLTTTGQFRHPSGLTEEDILLRGRRSSSTGPKSRRSNICDRLLRLILGIPEYD